ncbi:hypothetical protein NECAME_07435 [Necator americanus]|uniref:mannosyl-oligosaccharide glucosidase n=1 Tax=Necator americanus TaxID=51031 RepID=W2TQM5_NECAM|nr:hypothetical protein NECAME_07435 [Necator americanus]ETN83317.1 hypothetical protein NECAME_07435 [Necator americanus]
MTFYLHCFFLAAFETWSHSGEYVQETREMVQMAPKKWRGRNATTVQELNPKTLASGLDDYPRASHPSKEEYHLDLRCWMALGSRVMDRLAHLYGDDKSKSKYTEEASALANFDDLVQLHWSENKKLLLKRVKLGIALQDVTYLLFTYPYHIHFVTKQKQNLYKGFFDYGLHSDKVKLVKKPVKGAPGQYVVERSVVNKPRLGFVEDVFGYNSLFPLMLRLIPHESEQLGHILDKLADPELLWTKYGLRSLSRTSPYYAARNTEHDPPYWRGYIWVNANYMVLSALKHYGSLSGSYQLKAQNIFSALKENLVSNMAKEFNRTGYIWENYDDKTGQGRGSHPFNGWSSLVLMVMSDNMDI